MKYKNKNGKTLPSPQKVNSRKNAESTAKDREETIRRMESAPAVRVAAGFGVSLRTARK
jgi:methylthioribose-1-phosphate isomerase